MKTASREGRLERGGRLGGRKERSLKRAGGKETQDEGVLRKFRRGERLKGREALKAS